tara:strand:+ start:326 stop:826 length:501 start_codon:yes stop_codon:yes gene_type:complete
MSSTVGFIGWNGAQRAWNTSTWNTSPAFALTATASVGLIAQEGDAIVGPTGVAGTSAVGNVFSTNVGFGSTASIGAISTTRGDKAFVTGIAGTSAVGSTTVTGTSNISVTGIAGTSAIGAISTTRGDRVFVTGFSASCLVAPVEDFPMMWGQIIPNQTPSWGNVVV